MDKLDRLIDIIYPPRCPICGCIISWNKDKRICMECLEQSPIIEGPRCKKCSKPILQKESNYCFDCSNTTHYYDKGWALWLYEEPVKKGIQQFKYNHKKEYATLYAIELVKQFKEELQSHNINTIVPVPLHKKRQKQRGYNQAEVLAKAISKEINRPVEALLRRSINTLPQNKLSDQGRIHNIKNAFEINNRVQINNNVLLVDDVYTTGSTINECAKIIKIYHNVKVYYLSLAIGKGI
ncbi:ComF family protein [Natranaerovirga hydrolytica]|uniref:ComF family protein n=1 Tax=Natranaerovirga hydrolytica TaxID=680378 RepID=A0A4R1MTS3_9FIRM|nr:ComF family protein [Natranaerovirga hydrolytica]TCK93373.1 ComF family protein [Natranaerovirga hydrolytica]